MFYVASISAVGLTGDERPRWRDARGLVSAGPSRFVAGGVPGRQSGESHAAFIRRLQREGWLGATPSMRGPHPRKIQMNRERIRRIE